MKIENITIDQTIQLRKRWLDKSTVQRYVEALSSGAKFPPVVVFNDDDTFILADGFHRIAAYKFVGAKEIDAEVKDGDRNDAMTYAATANVTNGKPMSREEKKEAGKRLIKLTTWSDREIARRLAVSQPTVGRWRGASDTFVSDTATRTVTRNGQTYEMDISNIGSVAKLPDSIRLICGDFAEIANDLAPASFSSIITDPPYQREYLHLYELLARQAERLLKPGGSLLAMCGQSYITEILNLMTPHLTYHWLISYDTPGGQSAQMWTRKVNTFWKPILWFVKSEYTGAWRGDKIRSEVNDNDKRFHEWGQSESGIGKLVSEFAFDGPVLDPFVGGGTTGVVCYRLRKPFVGIDIDKGAIDTTRERILQEVQNATS